MMAIEQFANRYVTKTLPTLDGLHILIEPFDEILFIAVNFRARSRFSSLSMADARELLA